MGGRRGVSLVEVLLASALFAVTLVPLYDMLTSSERGSKSSMNRVRATNFAADLLEVLKAVPYHQLPVTEDNGPGGWSDDQVADHVLADSGGAEPVDLGSRIQPVTGVVPDFTRTLRIEEVSRRGEEGSFGSLKRIRVGVDWAEVRQGKREDSSLHLVYLITPDGLSGH